MNLIAKDLFEGLTAFGSTAFYVFVLTLGLVYAYYDFAIQLFVAYIISILVIVLIKTFYFKNRPKKLPSRTFIQRMSASSFPSLHSMRIMMLALLSILTFQDIYITFIAIFAIFAVGFTRIILSKHYIIDVVAGYIFGAVIALAIGLF